LPQFLIEVKIFCHLFTNRQIRALSWKWLSLLAKSKRVSFHFVILPSSFANSFFDANLRSRPAENSFPSPQIIITFELSARCGIDDSTTTTMQQTMDRNGCT
jgi:hypothetical protein